MCYYIWFYFKIIYVYKLYKLFTKKDWQICIIFIDDIEYAKKV